MNSSPSALNIEEKLQDAGRARKVPLAWRWEGGGSGSSSESGLEEKQDRHNRANQRIYA